MQESGADGQDPPHLDTAKIDAAFPNVAKALYANVDPFMSAVRLIDFCASRRSKHLHAGIRLLDEELWAVSTPVDQDLSSCTHGTRNVDYRLSYSIPPVDAIAAPAIDEPKTVGARTMTRDGDSEKYHVEHQRHKG